MQDSVIIEFWVNPKGLVDSVYLIKPKPCPFDSVIGYIKSYDFEGPLYEYYTTEIIKNSYLIRLRFRYNREVNKIMFSFYCKDYRKEE
uniref:Uncharacterized protein n=1 Tax=Prevotella sp. GTC17254 TaxID=3236794 RepID=A0AB33IX82_9BACT